MSLFEYDEEKVRRIIYEDGIAKGIVKDRKNGVCNMLKVGKYTLEDISEVFQISTDEVLRIKAECMPLQ